MQDAHKNTCISRCWGASLSGADLSWTWSEMVESSLCVGIASSSWGLAQLRGGRESTEEEILFPEETDQMNLYDGSADRGKPEEDKTDSKNVSRHGGESRRGGCNVNCGEWVCVGCHQSLDSCSAAGVRRQQQQQQLKPSSSSGQLALRAGPSCPRTQARRERAQREGQRRRHSNAARREPRWGLSSPLIGGRWAHE